MTEATGTEDGKKTGTALTGKGEPMDLIERQKAIDVADAVWSVTGDKNVAKVWDQLKDLPSAQPEIIRCKDCIYFTPEKSGEHWNVCRFYDAPKTADGYCNDAERKEE